MAEQAGERTEEATPKRQKEARDKGQVARSRELTTALLLMVASLSLYSFSGLMSGGVARVARSAFTPDQKAITEPKMMLQALYESVAEVMLMMAPVFISLFLIGLISPLATGGLSFSGKAIAPRMNRLSPASGFKRMFGMHALMELVKALAKISVVFLVGYLVVANAFPSLVALGNGSLKVSVAEAMDLVARSFFLIALSLIVIALIDVPYQLWNHSKQLRMTKQEVKDEYKETEGKPEVKGKIRQKQREIAQQRMMEAIPDADVVVTNPDHYAVALKYDPMKSSAPRVVAKGVDLLAEQIKKVALANDVPIMRAPPLARAIYHTTKLNAEVPHGLYLAVAQVLAYVFQLKNARKGKAPVPKPPKDLPIPPEFQFKK